MKRDNLNNAIPMSALLKYIVNERDKYKKKLEELTVYTKQLENQVMMSKDTKIKTLQKENTSLKKQLENTILEAQTLREEYRLSDWYQQLQQNLTAAKSEVNYLRQHIKHLGIMCKECRLKS